MQLSPRIVGMIARYCFFTLTALDVLGGIIDETLTLLRFPHLGSILPFCHLLAP